MMTFALIVVVVLVEIAAFSFLGGRLFPGSSSLDFPSFEDYIEHGRKEQLLCRELHIVEALVVCTSAGVIVALANGLGAGALASVIAAAVALEGTWLLLTYVVRPQKEQTYTIMRHLQIAFAVALLVGFLVCAFAGVGILPLLVASALFWVTWGLLMPL